MRWVKRLQNSRVDSSSLSIWCAFTWAVLQLANTVYHAVIGEVTIALYTLSIAALSAAIGGLLIQCRSLRTMLGEARKLTTDLLDLNRDVHNQAKLYEKRFKDLHGSIYQRSS